MEPEKSLIKEFVDGGWVIPLIGAAAMIARLLSTTSKMGIVEQIKKIITAAIASSVAWFVLEQTDISSLNKAIIYGIIGVVSPEVIQGLVGLAKRFQNNPEKYLSK